MPRAPRILVVLAALVVWSFATIFWSYAPSVSVTESTTTLLLAASAIAVSGSCRRGLERPAGALALGSAVAGLAALAGGPEVTSSTSGVALVGTQATFLGIDQNALAFHLSLGLASALFLVLRAQRGATRAAAIIMGGVLIAALILVGSRTGIGALIALELVFFVLSLRSVRRATVALGTLGMALITVRWIAAAGLVPARVTGWLEDPVATDSRTEIIKAFRLTEANWIMKGIGAGADADYLQATSSYYKNAHSAFWSVLIETGAVGLCLWVLLLAGLVYRAYRSADRDFFLLAAIPIALFFYTLGPLNSNMLWVVFGLALGAAPAGAPPRPEPPGSRGVRGADRNRGPVPRAYGRER